jgi:hypothetical protein
MPTDTILTPPASTPAAGSDSHRHEGVPTPTTAPGSAARPRVNQDDSPNSSRQKEARAKLAEIGRSMAEGKVTEDERVEGGHLPAGGVTDSPGIVGTPATPAKPASSRKEPSAEEKQAAQEKAGRLASAKRALALDGWKPEQIAKMDEGTLLEMGSHRAKNQADVNRNFAELRKAASTAPRNSDGTFAPRPDDKPAEGKAEGNGNGNGKKADGEAALPSMPDLVAAIEASKDDIGEPATKLLRLVETAMKVQNAQAQSERATLQNAVAELIYSRAYDSATSQYPEQMQGETKEFEANLEALIASGRYTLRQNAKLGLDAAYMTWGPPNVTRKAQREILARQEAAAQGHVDNGDGDNGASSETVLRGRAALRFAAQQMAANRDADAISLRRLISSRTR